MDESLVISLGRLPAYVYLADLFRGRRVLELGCGEGLGAAFLARSGAATVIGVDRSGAAIEAARARHRQPNLGFAVAEHAVLDFDDRSFDVVCIPDGAEASRSLGLLEEARRVLQPGGHLILTAPSADRVDRPELRAGVAYHELRGRLEPLFGAPRMIGVTPFVGYALVEFGDDEVQDLELDGQLATLGGGRGSVTEYVAVAGPLGGPPRGYLVVELPPAEGLAAVSRARGPAPERAFEDRRRVRREDETAALERRAAQAEEEASRASSRAALEVEEVRRRAGEELAARDAQLDSLRRRVAEELTARDEQIEAAQQKLVPLLRAAEAHQEELRTRSNTLAQRDKTISELRHELAAAQSVPKLDPTLVARVAELEGELKEGAARLTEKSAAFDKATARWKEAEQKTDELWRKVGELQKDAVAQREQGVETARIQRQAGQVALTRAVDEASKKLVSVQDNLARTERQRKELEAEVVPLRAQVAQLERDRDSSVAERDGARRERDAFGSDRDALRAEREKLRTERDTLQLERTGLRVERDSAIRGRESVRAERDAACVEREALRGERDVLRGERDGLRVERDGLRAERDAAVAARDGLRGELDSARTACDGLRGERDAALSARDDLRAEVDAVRASHAAAHAENERSHMAPEPPNEPSPMSDPIPAPAPTPAADPDPAPNVVPTGDPIPAADPVPVPSPEPHAPPVPTSDPIPGSPATPPPHVEGEPLEHVPSATAPTEPRGDS